MYKEWVNKVRGIMGLCYGFSQVPIKACAAFQVIIIEKLCVRLAFSSCISSGSSHYWQVYKG